MGCVGYRDRIDRQLLAPIVEVDAALAGTGLTIGENERVSLIGRNGEGKSTLLKVIAGSIKADDGERQVAQGVRISYLPQEVPTDLEGSVFEIVAQGLDELSGLLLAYHDATRAVMQDASEKNLERMAKAQHALENAGGWQFEQQVETTPRRLMSDALAAKTPVPGLFLTGQDVMTPGIAGALAGGMIGAAAVDPRVYRHFSW